MLGVHLPVYPPSTPPWVHHGIHPARYPLLLWCTPRTMVGDDTLGSTGRITVGMRRREPPFLLRCEERYASAHRVTPLFLVIPEKDRIDEGTSPYYTLWERHLCAECPPALPSDHQPWWVCTSLHIYQLYDGKRRSIGLYPGV